MHNGLETRPLAPLDLLFINGQREFRPAPKQSLQCAYALKARKLMAKTKMNSGAERKMPVRLAREIKFFRVGICLRIEVGCRQHGHDLLAPFQPDTAEFDLFANKPRFGELHHRNEPQEFCRRKADSQSGAAVRLARPFDRPLDARPTARPRPPERSLRHLSRREHRQTAVRPFVSFPSNLSRRQLIEQRLRLFQIERVEAFSEPAVDRSEKLASLLPLALIAPEPGDAGGGA